MFSMHGRVGASGTDRSGHLKLTSALDMIQDCSMYWIESEPQFMRYLDESGTVLVIVSRQMDIVRLPVYRERVTVQTRVFECRSFLGYRNTSIYGEDGGPCVLTWSVGAFVDRQTGKIARLTPEVLDTLTVDNKVDMEYLDKKIDLPDTPRQCLDPVPVRRGDIDLNCHMNNARYVETALELLPEDFKIKRLRIEYKSPARPGALLYPQVCVSQDGKYNILLTDTLGRPYSVMEFS